jgi:ankyrin repeat protein
MSNQTLDTQLMAAVEEQADLDTIRELVEAGADVNSVAGFDKKHSVLYQAAQNGMIDVIEFLLSKGANIELGEDGGVTPLMAAAEQGQLRSIIILIRHGANVRASSHDGWGPIDWAEASDYDTREIIRLLKNPSIAMSYEMPDQFMRLYRDEVE